LKEEMQRVGEVTEAATTGFTAQCYQLYELPPLGSLVKTKEGETQIYAVVGNASTAGIEPGRRPIARGRDTENEESLYQDNPQLEKLLKSEFFALVVGHKENSGINHHLPPRPARIHGFVYLCPDEEVKEFSQSFGFLNMLLNTTLPVPRDELIAACLRRMSKVQDDESAFLVAAGKQLAGLLGGDYNQLKAILERIKP